MVSKIPWSRSLTHHTQENVQEASSLAKEKQHEYFCVTTKYLSAITCAFDTYNFMHKATLLPMSWGDIMVRQIHSNSS